MKSLIAVASVLAFAVAPAMAAEGQVSHQSLANMGLASMKAISDVQGMNIRGLSIAVATGSSHATISGVGGSASSTNSYFAAGKHEANGNNISFAADSQIKTYGPFVTTTTNVVAAGGASSAHAH